jgi:hypothetical protein
MGVRFSGIPTRESADFAQRADGAIRILYTRAQDLMVVEHLSRDFCALLRYRLVAPKERRWFRWLSIYLLASR